MQQQTHIPSLDDINQESDHQTIFNALLTSGKQDGKKHADISHHGMVRDGLSTREKVSTRADFLVFPFTLQYRFG